MFSIIGFGRMWVFACIMTSIACTQGRVVNLKHERVDGISITYDIAWYSQCFLEQIPRLTQQDVGDGVPLGVFPTCKVLRFADRRSLDALKKGAQYFSSVTNRILIIPLGDTTVANFSVAYPDLDAHARNLSHILEKHSSLQGARQRIPDVFEVDCVREIISKPQYLEFKIGRGIGFITQYSQEFSPINNDDLAYIVQLLSRDGRYYIAARFALAHPALPHSINDVREYTEKQRFQYLKDIEKQLDLFPASSFKPSLQDIHHILTSLELP